MPWDAACFSSGVRSLKPAWCSSRSDGKCPCTTSLYARQAVASEDRSIDRKRTSQARFVENTSWMVWGERTFAPIFPTCKTKTTCKLFLSRLWATMPRFLCRVVWSPPRELAHFPGRPRKVRMRQHGRVLFTYTAPRKLKRHPNIAAFTFTSLCVPRSPARCCKDRYVTLDSSLLKVYPSKRLAMPTLSNMVSLTVLAVGLWWCPDATVACSWVTMTALGCFVFRWLWCMYVRVRRRSNQP